MIAASSPGRIVGCGTMIENWREEVKLNLPEQRFIKKKSGSNRSRLYRNHA
jgi:hypothetical protein